MNNAPMHLVIDGMYYYSRIDDHMASIWKGWAFLEQ